MIFRLVLVLAAPRGDDPRCGIRLKGVVAAKLCHRHLYRLHVGESELMQCVWQSGSSLEVKCVDHQIQLIIKKNDAFKLLFRACRRDQEYQRGDGTLRHGLLVHMVDDTDIVEIKV